MRSIWRKRGRPEFPFDLRGPAIPIVSDAAIATQVVGDGRFIPLVILDTTERPDIRELIELQDKVPPGDVVSAWASLLEGPSDHLALALHFQRPMEVGCVINFDLSRQGSVVELALKAHAIYLQAGKLGDRLSRTLDAPRMVAELGAELPPQRWDELWTKAITHRLRSEGLSRADARRRARLHVSEMRKYFREPATLGTGIYFDPNNATTNDATDALQNAKQP